MKILLIAPSLLDEELRPIRYRRAFLPPLSLAILAGLTPACHRVRAVNDLAQEIDFAGAYDLVGITAMTCQADRAYQIAGKFRARGIPVVLGGVHPTLLPHEAKAHADAVVIGEAERTWPRLLKDLENGKLGEFYKDEDYPALDSVPPPDWDCMDLRVYPRRLGSRLPLMPVYTTRGCPYGCSFCSVTRLYGKSYRIGLSPRLSAK